MDISIIPNLSKEDLISYMEMYKGSYYMLREIKTLKQLGDCTGYHKHLTKEQTELFISKIITEINRSIAIENENRRGIYNRLEARFMELANDQNNKRNSND